MLRSLLLFFFCYFPLLSVTYRRRGSKAQASVLKRVAHAYKNVTKAYGLVIDMHGEDGSMDSIISNTLTHIQMHTPFTVDPR